MTETSALNGLAPARPDGGPWRSEVFERSDDLLAIVGGDGTVLDVNEAWRTFAALNGGDPERTGIGSDYLAVCDRAAAAGDLIAAEVAVGLREVLTGRRAAFELEVPCASSLEDRCFQLRIGRIDDGGGRIAAEVRHHEITARHHREQLLSDQLTRDPDTGLPNQLAVDQLLAAVRAIGDPAAHPAQIVVELTDLAHVEAQHGLAVARAVRTIVAARLRRVVRADDTVAAVDGHRFLLLCPGADEEHAERVAQRVRRAVPRPVQVGARLIHPAVQVHHLRAPLLEPEVDQDTGPGRHLVQPAELPESRSLHGVLAHAHDVGMLFEQDGTIIWVSPSARAILGVEPEALVGRNGMELIHPSDRERATAAFLSIPSPGDHVRVEFRVVGADGGVRWVEEVAANHLHDPDVRAVFASLRDITERKHAEESIRFQARLLDAVGQSVVALDDDRRVSYWNDAAERLYGWTRDEAMGRLVTAVCAPAPGWKDRYDDLVDHVDQARPWSGELHLHHRDGSVVPALLTATPVFDDQGRQLATIAVSADMSEQRRSREIAARMSAVVDSSDDAILSVTVDGVVTTWNHAAETMLGLEEAEVLGRVVDEIVPAQLRTHVQDLRRRVASGETQRDHHLVHRGEDGSELHLSLSISPIRSADDEIIGAAIIGRDLSDRMALQRSITEDHERMAEAQQIARLGSFELELATLTTSRSAEFDRILGLTPADGDDQIIERIHPDDRHDIMRELQRVIDGVPVIERTHRILHPDGSLRWVRSRSTHTRRGGRPVVTGTVLDVTEQHRAEAALARQATHDSLTGLLNRTGLHAELTKALATDPEHRIAVAILDLDRFKMINDTLGHRVGDETLQAVASRLRSRLRNDDVVARIGGDEFVLARPGLADDLELARQLAVEALAALDEPIEVGPRRFELAGSIGVTLSAPVDSAESLLSDADSAMYLAKHHGGPAVSLFDEAASDRANRRLEIEAALHDAVDRGEMWLSYQPIVALSDERVRGVEALARWQHPRLGPVGPDEFVPIAETSGLIVPIGEWVVTTALAQLAQWRNGNGGADDLWVAINLSAAQLGEAGFVDWFAQELAAAGVPAACVHLEITERVLIDHVEQAVDTISALRRLGAKVSIDDFGTGYSSLSYLDRLPVDVLKVDRSFVDRLGPTARDTAVVRSILALARTLDLEVVVEGVERPEQLSIVRSLGCDLAQGFLWSRALSADHAGELLGRSLAAGS